MSFGKMNQFAAIISRTIGTDSEGFKSETDTTIANLRCYHEARHGSRHWANLATFSQATDLFVIRKQSCPTVKRGFFILHKNVRYKILDIKDVKERGMYLEIYAERVVSMIG